MYEFSREPHWPGQWPSYNCSVVLRAFTTCATLLEIICYCCFIYIMGIPDMVAVSFRRFSPRNDSPTEPWLNSMLCHVVFEPINTLLILQPLAFG